MSGRTIEQMEANPTAEDVAELIALARQLVRPYFRKDLDEKLERLRLEQRKK